MTQQIEGAAPAALNATQAADYAAQLRQQDPEAADRFLRTPIPPDAAAVVIGWLNANGFNELFPETLAVDVGTDGNMLVTVFRWKAGARDTLDNVARRDGVEVVEQRSAPVRMVPNDQVIRAAHAAGVPFRLLDGPIEFPVDVEPIVAAAPSGRPAMPARHAELADTWLVPNGIAEWLPERAVVVVAHGTITYDAFAFSDVPIVDHDGPLPGVGRGWGRNILLNREINPLGTDDPHEAVIRPRSVPLVQPLTDRVRALFAESELTLIER